MLFRCDVALHTQADWLRRSALFCHGVCSLAWSEQSRRHRQEKKKKKKSAWIPNGRLYKGLRICLVSFCVCSRPQQSRHFTGILALADFNKGGYRAAAT